MMFWKFNATFDCNVGIVEKCLNEANGRYILEFVVGIIDNIVDRWYNR